MPAESIARRDGRRIVLPGLVSAHSHAFQRGLRGRTQRRSARGSFWSWRALMYRFAERLDPDRIYALSRFAYAELVLSGVTAVGEFHYVHHAPDGRPYAERTAMADAVIRAARDVGLRISLLRVLYARGGAGRAAEGAQRRFCDRDVDDALRDVEALHQRYAADPFVRVGIAPHSVRAVPLPWLKAAARYSEERRLPLHIHVAEQRREIEECLAEHGRRPVTLLAEEGLVGPRFVAVHGTHLCPAEVRALGGSFVCVCRSTERDLGDGLPDVTGLVGAGARLCVGVDSHASSDAFDELRAVELDERTRTEARTRLDATRLLVAGTRDGAEAIGFGALDDEVELDANDPALAGSEDIDADDVVVFVATPRAVRRVRIGGNEVVAEGRLERIEEMRTAYERVLRDIA